MTTILQRVLCELTTINFCDIGPLFCQMTQEPQPQPVRRMWWGSREDRVPQLWPTGRPWKSIVKPEKQRPAGVRSREGTPSTAQSRRSKSVGPRASPVDLGRISSPLPFSPPRMLPEVFVGTSNSHSLWMGRGEFVPDVSPEHFPGAPRRSGLNHVGGVSCDSSVLSVTTTVASLQHSFICRAFSYEILEQLMEYYVISARSLGTPASSCKSSMYDNGVQLSCMRRPAASLSRIVASCARGGKHRRAREADGASEQKRG